MTSNRLSVGFRYREEVKRHAMTKIRLRNAERGLQQSEERNKQLQKEMEEFFHTFGRFVLFWKRSFWRKVSVNPKVNEGLFYTEHGLIRLCLFKPTLGSKQRLTKALSFVFNKKGSVYMRPASICNNNRYVSEEWTSIWHSLVRDFSDALRNYVLLHTGLICASKPFENDYEFIQTVFILTLIPLGFVHSMMSAESPPSDWAPPRGFFSRRRTTTGWRRVLCVLLFIPAWKQMPLSPDRYDPHIVCAIVVLTFRFSHWAPKFLMCS